MSSDSSGSKKKDPSKLNAADAKILLWVIIITIIVTLLMILIFGLSPSQQANPKAKLPESGTVMTERATYFCPFYNEWIGFWKVDPLFAHIYNYSCAIAPEGFCFNYDKDDPKQPVEEEKFADEREDNHLCPAYIRVSFPVDQEKIDKYWNRTFLGEYIMRTMYEHGEVHGYVCEDDVKYHEECEVDTEGINLDLLFSDCECSNGCGWTDVKVNTDVFSQNDGHGTYANLLWKHNDDQDVQTSGCSMVALVNSARGLGMALTIEEVANYSYNEAHIQDGGWDAIKTLADHYGLEVTYLFDNMNHVRTSTQAQDDQEKIKYVKQALASGKMVIASGTRTDECTAGYDCTFTTKGHYVAILAVTSENNFIVANAEESRSNTGWLLPADGVAKYMDIAGAIGLEGSGDLVNCSDPEETPEKDIIKIQATQGDVNVRPEKIMHGDICGRKVIDKEVIRVENKIEPDESGECEEGWYQIVDNKNAYWPGCYVCAKFFEVFEEEECTESVKKYTNSIEVRVRGEAATSGERIAELDCGTEVEVCKNVLHNTSSEKCTEGFAKITGGKYAGNYICSNFLDDTKPSCASGGGEEGGGEEGGENPPTVGPSDGKNLGDLDSKNYYAQERATYSNDVWREDGGVIWDSGCSLIAVANAAKYLGVTPNNPGTLATWSRRNVSVAGWTTSVKPLIKHVGLKEWDGSTYLWDKYETSVETKIAKIRETLASGGVVIAGGDRNRRENPYRYNDKGCMYIPSSAPDCTKSENLQKGYCVWSKCGHFVAIIGITADNKITVANAGTGRNGSASNNKLPTDYVLKVSNKAIAVYKK